MNLRKTGSNFIFAIPHFCEIFNMRRNQRYTPHKKMDHQIKIKDTHNAHIDGILSDISFDGMRLAASDKRMEDLKTISLSVKNFSVKLPCKIIWQHQNCYRMEFGDLDRQEFAKLEYFIAHYIKTAPDDLLELLM